ncbi:hypothetical protein GF378_02090 [Candidatus Pacearchaeota archaeon]|nr:hypothetical protein [Candidatus Pacearchaeota archaeon]
MAKKSKIQTPTWILEGYDSEEAYNKAKGIKPEKKKPKPKKKRKKKSKKKKSQSLDEEDIGKKKFKIRECPECNSDEVRVVVGHAEGEEAKEWECKKCGWKGTNIVKKELTEEQLLKYLDEKGEEVS